MRNANKKIIVLVLLLLVCCAAWFLLMRKPAGSGETLPQDSLPTLSEPENVTEIAVSGRDMESYVITRKDGAFSLDESTSIDISEPYLQVIWEKLLPVPAAKIDGEVSDEMELSDPLLLIQYRAGGETVSEVRVGRYASVRGGYYASSDGKTAWTVDEELFGQLKDARQEFYIRNLLDFSAESDFDRLKSIRLSGKKRGTDEICVEADETWFRLTEPFSYICDYRTLKINFLDPAMHLKGTRYLSEEKKDEYGFDDPEYVLTYNYDDKEIRILIGAHEDEGSYVCREGDPAVFWIRDEDLAFLSLPFTDLIGDSVYSRYINFADRFSITYQGKTDEFDLENASDYTDKWTMTHDGETYPYEKFIAFYTALMGAPRSREVQGAEPETDPDAAILVEVLLKSGKTDTLELKKISEREYDAVVDGECHFTTTASGVEAIISYMNKWRE